MAVNFRVRVVALGVFSARPPQQKFVWEKLIPGPYIQVIELVAVA